MARTLSIFALVAALSGSAGATAVEAFTLEDLSTFATKVVRARVLDIESAWEGRFVFTNVHVSVVECLKGSCEDREMTVRVLGGAVDDLVMDVQGVARYSVGEEVVLFLEPTGARWRTTGMAQGKFRVVPSAQGPVALRDTWVPVVGPYAAEARRLRRLPINTLVQGVHQALGVPSRVAVVAPTP